jgi:sulfur carrier protein
MIVQLNGEARELADGATVRRALELLDVSVETRGVAVAVGGEVVPRRAWEATVLSDGTQVEVVMAIGGG